MICQHHSFSFSFSMESFSGQQAFNMVSAIRISPMVKAAYATIVPVISADATKLCQAAFSG